MPADLAITWMKKYNAISGPLPPQTLLWLRSRHQMNPPNSYRIYRWNPKPWWKFWGQVVRVPEQPLDAIKLEGDAADPGGVYRSAQDWSLGTPTNQTGRADFQAWTDSGEACSGIMSSAYVWIAAED